MTLVACYQLVQSVLRFCKKGGIGGKWKDIIIMTCYAHGGCLG